MAEKMAAKDASQRVAVDGELHIHYMLMRDSSECNSGFVMGVVISAKVQCLELD